MSNDHPSAISGVFNQPFAEQIAYFRNKLGNLVPTRFWDDMLGDAHDRGFMVAGAAKADLLTDLAAAVDKAISEGRGIEEFRRDFDAIVRRHGWTGWTGQGTVQGEAWRVKTILRTNAYTSWSAGRLAQLRASNFRVWIYRHGGSEEPRPQHLDWDGLMLSPDHPFWAKAFPPSDWGCSCYVVGAHSHAAARHMGGDPNKKLPEDWDAIDPLTGEPEGIGRGWGHAPGNSVADEVRALAGKIGSWDYQMSKAFMSELPPGRADALADAYRALPSTADDARRYAQRVLEGSAAGDAERRALSPQRTLGLLRSDQVAEINRLIDADVEGYDFSFDVPAAGHIFRKHSDAAAERSRGQRAITPADFALLPQILSRPDQIRPSGTTEMGEQLLAFEKRIGSETYVAEMAVRGRKRRTLALKTFYIRVSGKK